MAGLACRKALHKMADADSPINRGLRLGLSGIIPLYDSFESDTMVKLRKKMMIPVCVGMQVYKH